HTAHDPSLVRAFIDANADLVDAPTRAALAGGDARAVAHALDGLSPSVRALLDRLSPARAMPDVRARVIVVHGYADEAVPYTESPGLAAARPARTDVILLHAVGHVEAARGPVWRAALDGLRLLLAFHALRCAA